jgi:hypothetical protein
VQVAAGVALGTTYVCRLVQASDDRVLESYTGLSGCTAGDGPFTAGQTPCGALFTMRTPSWQRR